MGASLVGFEHCCSKDSQQTMPNTTKRSHYNNSISADSVNSVDSVASAAPTNNFPDDAKLEEYNDHSTIQTHPGLQLGIINENEQTRDVKEENIDKLDKLKYKEYTMNTVEKHNSLENEIWIIIDNNIYDITPFVKNNLHPASNVFIEPYYGKDATEPFEATFHSNDARKLLENYKIGQLPENNNEPQYGRDISLAPSLDQFKLKSPMSGITVNRIFIYPVKSCKGIEVSNCLLTSSGFIDDRIYAFCNKKTKKVINQLTYPQLSQININFIADEINCNKGIKINNQMVPLVKHVTHSLMVEWKSSSTKIKVCDQGEEISKWITSYINEPNEEFILVRIHENNYRKTEEYFALSFAPKCTQLMSGFQNYCSVLLCSEESLTELNKRYKNKNDLCEYDEKEIQWDRFRMNIIIIGVATPHYEDYAKHIRFGVELNKYDETDQAEILWSRRRYLSAVPQVNQNNSIQTKQPIETARRYRNAITLNDRTSLPGDNAVFFGSFYCVKHSGIIRVGQQVICEQEQFEFNTVRTERGKSFFGLTSRNIGSQFEIDYHSQYEDFKLIKKEIYNYNTMKFRFKMLRETNKQYHESLKESLKLGDHYLLKFKDNNGNLIIRAYTPVFDNYDDEKNDMCFDLLVKIYANGKMSQHLQNMEINDIIKCKQDYGKVCYVEINKIRFGDPRFTMYLPYTFENVKNINLIAGGSGITPIYQIITNINLNKQYDDTKISFIYVNKTIKDILLKDKLEQIAKTNKNIKIYFTITRPNKHEMIPKNIDNGRISKDMCKKYLYPPNKDNQVVTLICGPYKMEQSIKKILDEIGYDKKSVAVF